MVYPMWASCGNKRRANHITLPPPCSTVLNNTCRQATSSGSSPSPCNSFPRACCSQGPCGSGNPLAGCSSRTTAGEAWRTCAGSASWTLRICTSPRKLPPSTRSTRSKRPRSASASGSPSRLWASDQTCSGACLSGACSSFGRTDRASTPSTTTRPPSSPAWASKTTRST